MKTIALIIKREYLTRVRKKSFYIMTFAGPLLFALLITIPFWLSSPDQHHKLIKVIDQNTDSIFYKAFPESDHLHFIYKQKTFQEQDLQHTSFDGILVIPPVPLDDKEHIKYYTDKLPGLSFKRLLEKSLEQALQKQKLINAGIDPAILTKLNTKVSLETKRISHQKQGGQNIETATIVGFSAAILIYFFIFMYGIMVMRGVMEEKSNRIFELLLITVKPFRLMAGKIMGLAFVGLTQFCLWVLLTVFFSGILTLFTGYAGHDSLTLLQENESTKLAGNIDTGQIFMALHSLNLPLLLGCFLFYFLGGYFLYSALYAAIGAAIEPDADNQQFTLPVTLPLLFSFIMAQVVITNPDSNMAFWFSIIPLTSPVIMMVRMPFGVPLWETGLSMLMLIAGLLAAIWLAAKIYKTGILMYGKKVSIQELGKWLFK